MGGDWRDRWLRRLGADDEEDEDVEGKGVGGESDKHAASDGAPPVAMPAPASAPSSAPTAAVAQRLSFAEPAAPVAVPSVGPPSAAPPGAIAARALPQQPLRAPPAASAASSSSSPTTSVEPPPHPGRHPQLDRTVAVPRTWEEDAGEPSGAVPRRRERPVHEGVTGSVSEPPHPPPQPQPALPMVVDAEVVNPLAAAILGQLAAELSPASAALAVTPGTPPASLSPPHRRSADYASVATPFSPAASLDWMQLVISRPASSASSQGGGSLLGEFSSSLPAPTRAPPPPPPPSSAHLDDEAPSQPPPVVVAGRHPPASPEQHPPASERTPTRTSTASSALGSSDAQPATPLSGDVATRELVRLHAAASMVAVNSAYASVAGAPQQAGAAGEEGVDGAAEGGPVDSEDMLQSPSKAAGLSRCTLPEPGAAAADTDEAGAHAREDGVQPRMSLQPPAHTTSVDVSGMESGACEPAADGATGAAPAHELDVSLMSPADVAGGELDVHLSFSLPSDALPMAGGEGGDAPEATARALSLPANTPANDAPPALPSSLVVPLALFSPMRSDSAPATSGGAPAASTRVPRRPPPVATAPPAAAVVAGGVSRFPVSPLTGDAGGGASSGASGSPALDLLCGTSAQLAAAAGAPTTDALSPGASTVSTSPVVAEGGTREHDSELMEASSGSRSPQSPSALPQAKWRLQGVHAARAVTPRREVQPTAGASGHPHAEPECSPPDVATPLPAMPPVPHHHRQQQHHHVDMSVDVDLPQPLPQQPPVVGFSSTAAAFRDDFGSPLPTYPPVPTVAYRGPVMNRPAPAPQAPASVGGGSWSAAEGVSVVPPARGSSGGVAAAGAAVPPVRRPAATAATLLLARSRPSSVSPPPSPARTTASSASLPSHHYAHVPSSGYGSGGHYVPPVVVPAAAVAVAGGAPPAARPAGRGGDAAAARGSNWGEVQFAAALLSEPLAPPPARVPVATGGAGRVSDAASGGGGSGGYSERFLSSRGARAARGGGGPGSGSPAGHHHLRDDAPPSTSAYTFGHPTPGLLAGFPVPAGGRPLLERRKPQAAGVVA